MEQSPTKLEYQGPDPRDYESYKQVVEEAAKPVGYEPKQEVFTDEKGRLQQIKLSLVKKGRSAKTFVKVYSATDGFERAWRKFSAEAKVFITMEEGVRDNLNPSTAGHASRHK